MTLANDTEHGRFDGTSHTGTLLVLRNTGRACSLPRPVALVAYDTHRHRVALTNLAPNPFRPIVHGVPLQLGHGPVVLPLVLEPDAEATAALRWIDGPVAPHATCVTIASLAVTLDDGTTTSTRIDSRLCGDARAGLGMEIADFALDPAP